MAVPTSYLTRTTNLDGILAAIQRAQVPNNFTYEFFKQLGFASSADRPTIAVLKSLRFLDAAGIPLDRYKRYRDSTQARQVMAEAVRDAYADVFAINQTAQELSVANLKGVFKRLSNKGDSVIEKMAATFKALAERSDFAAPPATNGVTPVTPQVEGSSEDEKIPEQLQGPLRLHHDIHIHLPESTDIGVYDAIFRALRQSFSS